MSKFDNISKGDWQLGEEYYENEYEMWALNISIGDRSGVITVWGGFSTFLLKQDAELIAFAGNLAQKYNIEHFEDVVEALRNAVRLIPPSMMKQNIENALKSIEKS